MLYEEVKKIENSKKKLAVSSSLMSFKSCLVIKKLARTILEKLLRLLERTCQAVAQISATSHYLTLPLGNYPDFVAVSLPSRCLTFSSIRRDGSITFSIKIFSLVGTNLIEATIFLTTIEGCLKALGANRKV